MRGARATNRWLELSRLWQRTFKLRRWHWAHDLAVEAGLNRADAVSFADDDLRSYTGRTA